MAQETKTRTYVLIIVLALAAFGVDRFLIGGHAAPAEAATKGSARAAVERVLAMTPTGLPIPELPFPRNLPDVPAGPASRDLFAFPSAVHDGRAGRRTADARRGLSDAAAFAVRNHLYAVLSDGGLQVAVVNGLWMQTGQTLDACTLTRVEGTRAYFQCAKDEAILDLVEKPRTR